MLLYDIIWCYGTTQPSLKHMGKKEQKVDNYFQKMIDGVDPL